jgi:hypothetical protein
MILKQVCEFLNEDFVPQMLNHHQTPSTQTWSHQKGHRKTAKPITTEYVEQYKTLLNTQDKMALEGLIGGILKETGYPVGDASVPVPFKLETQINECDTVSGLAKAEYKTWHKDRRRKRRDRGIWKDSDRKTMLWGMV